MKRSDPDVFGAPAWPAAVRGEAMPSHPLSDLPLPEPGPTSAWTAEGVVNILEPLALPERAARMRQILEQRTSEVTVLLDNPHDPHNASAVLRSCDAFGIQFVHVAEITEAIALSRKVAKGSHQWVDIHRYNARTRAAERLVELGYELLVTHPEGELSPLDLGQVARPALVLGNEHEGVHPDIARLAKRSIRIPMRGFVESLNLSVSAAILVQAATQGRPPSLTEAQKKNILARWLRLSVPRSEEILAQFDAR